MNLPRPGQAYSQADETQARRSMEEADRQNRKRGQDVEIAGRERLIMSDSITGARGVLTIVAGVPTWTAL